MGVFTAVLGQVALDRGRPAAAARRLREGEVLLRERDIFGYRPWVLACLATALAQLGQTESAEETMRRARASANRTRFFDPDIALAEAWCHAAAGRPDEALAAAGAAADQAHRAGLLGFEAPALHLLTRLGRPGASAERLRVLAAGADSPLWRTYAAHADAAVARDAVRLEEVTAAFAKLGAVLLAAEAAADAAAVYDRQGERAEAFRVTTRLQALVAECDEARTPALRRAARAPELTDREHEVAVLAAEGLTSKAIAERLVVSPRTVESHLYRVFSKLGVSDRAQLTELFTTTR
jgi:DNA-binding NarL/FixJ family response regulator